MLLREPKLVETRPLSVNLARGFQICRGALALYEQAAILLVVDGPLEGVAIGRGHWIVQHRVRRSTMCTL